MQVYGRDSEAADSLAERDFRNEIDLMKAVGYHERLGKEKVKL